MEGKERGVGVSGGMGGIIGWGGGCGGEWVEVVRWSRGWNVRSGCNGVEY